MTDPILRVEGLKKYFDVNTSITAKLLSSEREKVKAVDGVSFELREGEAFGIAGESGCGKTTTAKTAIHLLEPTAGSIYYRGEDLTDWSAAELKQFRREAQIIHQDPYESINPRFTVRDWIVEPLVIHDILDPGDRTERAAEMLERVHLSPPGEFLDRYPNELSGGERQRVQIARALIVDPSLLLADEPASMLDVSIRARVMDLFTDLQADFGLTALYISHDISLLKYLCDRIAIMYLGEIIEVGPTEEIIGDPKHPYTQAMVASVPTVDPDVQRESVDLQGEVPDPVDVPSGCRFHPRCPEAMEECSRREPPTIDLPGSDRSTKCLLYEDE